jgi:hypothetical protein
MITTIQRVDGIAGIEYFTGLYSYAVRSRARRNSLLGIRGPNRRVVGLVDYDVAVVLDYEMAVGVSKSAAVPERIIHLFWQRERLRAEKRRRAKEQLRAQKRQLAEEQRRADEQRWSEKRRQEQEEAIKSFLELMRGGGKRLERRSRGIPQPVKIAVVTRDGGKCRRCGSIQDLQYDRIVPNSRGGSSTDVNNIQLLCGKCSILKSNRNIAKYSPYSAECVEGVLSEVRSSKLSIERGC